MFDSIGDLITRVRNAQLARHKVVTVPFSRKNYSILKILQDEGYIIDFAKQKREKKKKEKDEKFCFSINLKYYNKLPVISDIIRVSKPGRRVYSSAKNIPKFYNGLGVFVLSTSNGIMSGSCASGIPIGGEILFGVF